MLAKFSVRKPYTVLVAVILVILLGVVAFTRMTPDLLPDINLPYVVIVTTYAGANPEQVETMVTKPIEQSMATLGSIKSIQSQSDENVSMVIMEFSDKANMDSVTVDIREKINLASAGWDEYVGEPYILKLNPNMLPVNVSAITYEGYDTIGLTTFLEEKIMYRLEGIDGVASVSVSGAVEEKLTILLNQDKINVVNARIQGEISDQFAVAKRKIKNGIAQAKKGRSQIAAARESLQQSLHDLKEQIENLRGQIGDEEIPYLEVKAEITAQMLALTTQKEALQGQQSALQAMQTTLEGLLSQKAQMEQNGETGAPAYEQVLNALTELDAQLTSMGMTRDTLSTQVERITEAIGQIDGALAELQGVLDMLNAQGTTPEEARQKLAEMDTKGSLVIYENLAKLQVNEQSLTDMIGELTEALDGIEDSMAQALDKADLSELLTMDTVAGILKAQNFAMPAGYVDENGQDVLIRIGDKLGSVSEVENLMLFDMKLDDVGPIYLSDVADVVKLSNADSIYARLNGQDGIILSFSKQSNYATADVTESIAARMEELSAEYPGLAFTSLMDQGDYIHLVVNSVLQNLLLGAVLAVLILYLFLRDLRPTFIIACSIPISVTFAIVLMYFSGVTLNIISLAGLAIGVGMLVDNSIVVIENIYRLRSMGISSARAAISGASQVTAAIISSTLTTVCVFVPIVFVEGLTRQLFTDMALTIAYSLLASLVVALTLVPSAATGLLRKPKEEEENGIFRRFLARYEALLRWALNRRALVMVLSVVMLIASGVWEFSNGFAFMPDMDSPQISFSVQMPDGATLEDTAAMGDEITARIRTIEDVESVGLMLSGGMGSQMGLSAGSDSTDALTGYIILKNSKKNSSIQIADRINELCKGLDCEVSVAGSSMNSSMELLGGSGISINLYGEDMDDLRSAADEVAAILRTVEGAKEVNNGMEDVGAELRIRVDKNKAMAKGLTVAQVYAEIAKAVTVEKSATTLNLTDGALEVVIVSGKAEAMTKQDIRNYRFEVTSQNGEKETVWLSSIASFEETTTLNGIRRSEQRRLLTVSAAIESGYNVAFVTADAKEALASYQAPDGVTIEFKGENETIMDAMKDMMLMMGLSIVIIYCIMVAQFQSLLSPAIVMFTIPLAFTGGLMAIALCGFEMSVIAMLGFIMLVGIIVNNGIVLIDYVNQLRIAGRERREAIVEAGVTRLRPVLMTALTTILGLVPLGLGIGMGAELMQPVAVACIGGLIYATLMTLIVVPVMYDLLHRRPIRTVSAEDLSPVEL